jgi:cysteine desulfurase / selenocysteine lyase
VLIDGAQWVAHGATDVQALDADFYAFSGHKLYGPTGIGVLYGKRGLLEAMPPYQGGGDMIEQVTFEKTTYAHLPNKFEAGTPHIAGAVGLAAAIEWLEGVGFERIGLARAASAAAGHRAAVGDPRSRDQGHRTAQGGRGLLGHGRSADRHAGYRHAARSARHLYPHRPSLLPAADGSLGIASTARASFGVYKPNWPRSSGSPMRSPRSSPPLARRPAQGSPSTGTRAVDDADPLSAAAAESPEAAAEEIAEIFELLPDWPMRHQQIMDLGERLPPCPMP